MTGRRCRANRRGGFERTGFRRISCLPLAWIQFIRGFSTKTVSFDLDDEFDFDDEFVTLVRVEVKERPLSVLLPFYPDEDMKGRKKLGKHDYIIFTAIRENGERFSFVAEKIRKRTFFCGMRSHAKMSLHSSATSASRSRFVWEFDDPWTVSTEKFKSILEATGRHYNVFSANCWSFATSTVEAVLYLYFLQSLHKQDFKAVRGCVKALEKLEEVKRPLPRDVFRLFVKPLSRKNPETLRRIAKWFNCRSGKSASSRARNCDTDCDTDEAELDLCLLHSQRMHYDELARGYEKALQQLQTVKPPFSLDVLRLVYKPLSRKTRVTWRKIHNWWVHKRRSVKWAPGIVIQECAQRSKSGYTRLY